MKIRLGYSCIVQTLDGITSSTPYPYTKYLKDQDHDILLTKIIASNLEALDQIIEYNRKNDIHFFRLSSNMIPLVTIPTITYDYLTPFAKEYKQIGQKIKNAKMRVDFHPDQFAVLNSTRGEVIESTKRILKHHQNLLKALQIEDPLILLHIGSSVLGKANSITRFKNQFRKLDSDLQKMLAIENDDKTFTVQDTLSLAQDLQIPMVLDYHHHLCNHEEPEKEIDFEAIFKTWQNKRPKVHFSSPKSKLKKEFRSHHDYIDSNAFIAFLEKIKNYPYDLDIMLEAKKKDEALFKLVRELKYKTDYLFLDSTTFII